MGAFKLSKSMVRPLTDDENDEIVAYIKANKDKPVADTLVYFEERFKTPITEHCIRKLILAVVMGWK